MTNEDLHTKIMNEIDKRIEAEKNKIGKEYIEKAEKWFIENLGEHRKKYVGYDEVIIDIAKEIKDGKEPDWTTHYYDLTTD